MIYDSPHIISWIQTNYFTDPARLLLKYGNDPQLRYAIMQIQCRRKAVDKIPSFLENPHFRFPTLLSAQQCTSQALALFHASLVPLQSRVLDLTCGLGIDVFTIARNSLSVDTCEIDPQIAETARFNASVLGLDNLTIFNTNATEFIANCANNSFDVIFADPDRRGDGDKRLYALNDCSPDITAIQNRLFDLAPVIIVKASPMLDVTHTIGSLRNISEIIAVGTPRECKELLIICRKGFNGEPRLRAVTVGHNDILGDIRFYQSEENATLAVYGMPDTGNVLYEPYPATMKIAPFRIICSRYELSAISPSSHLYFNSGKNVQSFPGRQFIIDAIFPFNKTGIRNLSSMDISCDITTRNFPLSAPELSKKLKIRSNSAHRLFATTAEKQKILILTHPV